MRIWLVSLVSVMERLENDQRKCRRKFEELKRLVGEANNLIPNILTEVVKTRFGHSRGHSSISPLHPTPPKYHQPSVCKQIAPAHLVMKTKGAKSTACANFCRCYPVCMWFSIRKPLVNKGPHVNNRTA